MALTRQPIHMTDTFCGRCGQPFMECPHWNTHRVMDPEHAARTRARYLIGREHNPDHDTTDYSYEGPEENRPHRRPPLQLKSFIKTNPPE